MGYAFFLMSGPSAFDSFGVEMKQWLTDYFSFTYKERVGILVLLLLTALVWAIPLVYRKPTLPDPTILEKADRWIDSSHVNEKTLTYFDPNTISVEEWRAMGIAAPVASRIIKYREMGGKFRKPADLTRIYGMDMSKAAQLLPYVRIKEHGKMGSAFYRRNSSDYISRSALAQQGGIKQKTSAEGLPFFMQQRDTFKVNVQIRKFGDLRNRYKRIDINEADSAAWESLPGIGSKLAQRIIRFRDRCGGFYDIGQLAGVYGISDSVFLRVHPFLVIKSNAVQKILLNMLSAEELCRHPYIQFQEAKAIEKYRKEHGPFRNVTDLLKLPQLSGEWLERIRPYISLEEQ